MSALAKPAGGVLDEEYHAALLRDVDSVVRSANIPKAMLAQSMVGVCSESEIQYIRRLRKHSDAGIYGLVLEGPKPLRTPLERFSVMAAACLRNYISARVMTLQDVVSSLGEKTMPEPTVLLIPNFQVSGKGHVAEWDVPELLGLLYDRQSAGLQTVVYVHSLSMVANAYGTDCAQHLSGTRFVKVRTSEPIVES